MLKYTVNNIEYTEFETIEESRKWGEEHYHTWARAYYQAKKVWEHDKEWCSQHGLNPYNQFLLCFSQSIDCYCGFKYKEINNFMRFHRDTESQMWGKMSAIIQMHINSTPIIKDNIVVYRLVPNEFVETMYAQHKNSKEDIPLVDKGFLSTSLVRECITQSTTDYGKYHNLLKLYLRTHALGVYVPSVVDNREDEQELLLDSCGIIKPLNKTYYDSQIDKRVFECELSYFKPYYCGPFFY